MEMTLGVSDGEFPMLNVLRFLLQYLAGLITPKFITKARMMMTYHPVIIMAYLSPWGIRDTPPW
jgi:hypothetical protein